MPGFPLAAPPLDQLAVQLIVQFNTLGVMLWICTCHTSWC
jgi:hypothetical protein